MFTLLRLIAKIQVKYSYDFYVATKKALISKKNAIIKKPSWCWAFAIMMGPLLCSVVYNAI